MRNPFVPSEHCEVWHRATTWPYAMYKDCFLVAGTEHAASLFDRMLAHDPEWYPDGYWLRKQGWEAAY